MGYLTRYLNSRVRGPLPVPNGLIFDSVCAEAERNQVDSSTAQNNQYFQNESEAKTKRVVQFPSAMSRQIDAYFRPAGLEGTNASLRSACCPLGKEQG